MANLHARPKPPYLHVDQSHPLGRGLVLYHPVEPSHDGTGLGITGWCPRSPDIARGAWAGAASPRDFIRTRFGYASQHLGQDGSGHFKLGTDALLLSSMTIGAVIRVANQGFGSLEPNGGIMAKAASGSLTEWSLGFTASGFEDVKARFYLRTDTTTTKDVTHQTTLPKQEWLALYGIWDGSNITMSLNKIPSSSSTAISGTLRNNAYDVTLGARKSAISTYYVASADIAGAWIWDRALTKEEISRHVDDPFAAHYWTPKTYVQVAGGSDTVEVTPVVITQTAPSVGLSASDTIDLSATTITEQVPAVGLSSSDTVSVDPASISLQVPAVGLSTATTVEVEPVTLSASAPAVGLSASDTVAVDPATISISVPAVGLSTATSISVETTTLSISAPSVGLSAADAIAIDPATLTLSVPDASLSAADTVSVTPVTLQASIPAVQLGTGAQLEITPAVVQMSVPSVGLTADETIAIEAVDLTIAPAAVVLTVADTIAVSPATLSAFVPAVGLTVPVEIIIDPAQSSSILAREDSSTIPARSKSSEVGG